MSFAAEKSLRVEYGGRMFVAVQPSPILKKYQEHPSLPCADISATFGDRDYVVRVSTRDGEILHSYRAGPRGGTMAPLRVRGFAVQVWETRPC